MPGFSPATLRSGGFPQHARSFQAVSCRRPQAVGRPSEDRGVKHWTISYGDGAKSDILGIVDYIAGDSSIKAEKALDRLEQRISTLATLPERGRAVPELQWHGITTVREILERPRRILYQIRAKTVVIVAVYYDGRRHLQDVLMERFLRQ